MALRLIEIVLPQPYEKEVDSLLKDQKLLHIWKEKITENQLHMRILLPTEESAGVLDLLEKRFYKMEGFRIILIPVEASIPRPKPEEGPPSSSPPSSLKKDSEKKTARISREELYSDIERVTGLSWIFVFLVILASIVASIGILRNNVIFIIGAMVIAPVLGPNVALSFSTTLGDVDLSQKAIKTIAVGTGVALIFSSLLGLILHVNPEIPELVSKTEVNFGDIALALAAGSAAALSFTSGLLSALIGVMVAVALLPPLVTLGMLMGSGQWKMAFGALLLFLVNLICVNLAGIVTFFIQGIRPLTWWEANRAKRATRTAIMLWTGMLVSLVFLILLSQ